MKKLMDKIFAKEEVNTGRQVELDIAKAILVFALAMVHITICCVHRYELEEWGIPAVMDSIIGGPYGAPMFMFAMGIGLAFAKKKDGKTTMYRGLTILVLAFVLNMCRAGIPYVITYFITGDYDYYIKPLWTHIFSLDILAFAGPALILMGALQCAKLKDWQIFLTGLAMSIIGDFFIDIDLGNPVANILAGFFIGTENADMVIYTDFPLLHWFIFPAFGLMFGNMIKRVKDKKTFYLTFSPICNVIAIASIIVESNICWGMFSEGDNCFYHMNTLDVFFCICANVGILGVYYWISQFMSEKLIGLTNLVSRNINRVYCIHWVFVNVIVNCIIRNVYSGGVYLPVYVYLPLGALISVVSIWIATKVEKRSLAKRAA